MIAIDHYSWLGIAHGDFTDEHDVASLFLHVAPTMALWWRVVHAAGLDVKMPMGSCISMQILRFALTKAQSCSTIVSEGLRSSAAAFAAFFSTSLQLDVWQGTQYFASSSHADVLLQCTLTTIADTGLVVKSGKMFESDISGAFADHYLFSCNATMQCCSYAYSDHIYY